MRQRESEEIKVDKRTVYKNTTCTKPEVKVFIIKIFCDLIKELH